MLAGSSPVIEGKSASLVETTVQAAMRLASGQAAIGATASAIALTEGVLTMMFWGKLKLTMAIGVAAVLLSGTGLIGYRAVGCVQAPATAARQQPKDSGRPQGKPAAPAPAAAPSAELETIGRARIAVAKKLRPHVQAVSRRRDRHHRVSDAQQHYDEVVADVMVKTDADRVRYLESRVAGLKQLEDRAGKMHASGMIRESDVLTLELARLDAEYALVKAKLKTATESK